MNQDKNHQNQGPRLLADDQAEIVVEKLIGLADAGPGLPPGGADRMKDAIRPVWQAEVRLRAQRRRKGMVIGGLAAAAGVILAVAVMSHLRQAMPPVLTPVALLEGVIGQIEIRQNDGVPQYVGVDQRGIDLSPGTSLHAGTGVRAALRLAGGQSLRVDSLTRLHLVSARVLRLDSGAVYIDSEGLDGLGVEILTAFGTVRDIGTQFEVRHEGSGLMIRVREGIVAVEKDEGNIEIKSGTEASLASDGSYSTQSLSAFDSVWQWVQEVAPEVQIEGRSLKATLVWVSRETGLDIQFSDPGLEGFAESTILHGSAEGLTPVEVPDLVMPGCGLEVVRRPGVLAIQRIGENNERRIDDLK